MSATIVADAVETAGRVRDAQHFRAFRHAVSDFIRVLGSVPDAGPSQISSDGARLLQSLGEDVIDYIEQRAEDTAHAADAQVLVGSVYEIRRLLEGIYRFRQHYAIARHV
jgi:hypothetical protein